jgi:rubrerythrin
MEPGAIFLLLGVFVIVGLFIAQPFNSHWRVKIQRSQEVSTLLTEREHILSALMELNSDYEIGKIPAEEYSSQRASLIQKGSEILRQLDEIQATKPASLKTPADADISRQQASLISDEDLEDLIAQRRTKRQQKTAGFCPNCGKPILQSDQFCPSCGQTLRSK